MIVNGSETSGLTVWENTVNVTPNTTYELSAFATSAFSGSPAELQFTIDGTPTGSALNLSPDTGTWQELGATWDSGANTSLNFGIVSNGTIANGNDFALDDISAAPTAVPFDASSTSGLLILGGIVGISRLRKQLSLQK